MQQTGDTLDSGFAGITLAAARQGWTQEEQLGGSYND